MFGFLAFLPRTIWTSLQLLCLGFCLGIATNPTITGNLLLSTFHHIITPTITIIITISLTIAHTVTSAFSPTFAAATEIWDTTIPKDQDWSTTATAAAAIVALTAIWKKIQNHQNKTPPYGNRRDESLLDHIKNQYQPAMGHLDEISQVRVPTNAADNNTKVTTESRNVVGWVKEHVTALLAVQTLTRNLELANKAREKQQEQAERIPAQITKEVWEDLITMAPGSSIESSINKLKSSTNAMRRLIIQLGRPATI